MEKFLTTLSFAFIVIGLMACNRLQTEPIAIATRPVPESVTQAPTPTSSLELASQAQAITATPASLTPTLQPDAPPLTTMSTAAIMAESSTSTFEPPTLPTPQTEMPGWMWYQDNEANFTISYPQTWIIKPAYRQGQTIFSSPETNSEVRVDTWPAPDNQNWLEGVRQDPHRFILTLAPESIVANATVLGQSAFFHF